MNAVSQQTRFLADMTLRELVDGIDKNVIAIDTDESILIGVLKGVRTNIKSEITGLDVRIGKEIIQWKDCWKNAVFA